MAQITFRFAPSPNGLLHLGHAFSALLNAQLARDTGGALILRIEDIDSARCSRQFCDAILEDLAWLGLRWQEPVLRQSDHLAIYMETQAHLRDAGLLYPCFCKRGDVMRAVEGRANWPHDPDGVPLYPGTCRTLSPDERQSRIVSGAPHAWRLDMAAAFTRTGPLTWAEWSDEGTRSVVAKPLAWGDVIVARKDIGTSYHTAVIVDDAAQGVTHIVRGADLFAATAVHRVLQALFEYPAPVYRHHALLRDNVGDKLAKSKQSTPLRTLRSSGVTPEDVRARLGFT